MSWFNGSQQRGPGSPTAPRRDGEGKGEKKKCITSPGSSVGPAGELAAWLLEAPGVAPAPVFVWPAGLLPQPAFSLLPYMPVSTYDTRLRSGRWLGRGGEGVATPEPWVTVTQGGLVALRGKKPAHESAAPLRRPLLPRRPRGRRAGPGQAAACSSLFCQRSPASV